MERDCSEEEQPVLKDEDVLMQALRENLRLECASKEQLYATLLKEYQETREQLAEARLHIDRLRFGTHFTVNHVLMYRITDQSQQQDSSAHSYDSPVCSSCSLPRPGSLSASMESVSLVDQASVADGSSTLSCSMKGAHGVAMEEESLQFYSHPEEQQQQKEDLGHGRSEYLGQIRELQKLVAGITDGINRRNASLDEVRARLLSMQQLHQRVAGEIGRLLQGEREEEDKDGEDDRGGRQLIQAEVSEGGNERQRERERERVCVCVCVMVV